MGVVSGDAVCYFMWLNVRSVTYVVYCSIFYFMWLKVRSVTYVTAPSVTLCG